MTLGKYFELKRKSVGVELVLSILSLFMAMFAAYYTSPDRQLDLDAIPFYDHLLYCIGTFYEFMFGSYDWSLTLIFAFPDLFFGISAVLTLTLSMAFLLHQKSFGLQRNGTFMSFHIFSVVYSISILLTKTTYLPIVYIFIEFYYLRLLYQDVKTESAFLPCWFGAALFTELLRYVLLIIFMEESGNFDDFPFALAVFYYACKVITGVLFYQLCDKLVYHKKPVQANAD